MLQAFCLRFFGGFDCFVSLRKEVTCKNKIFGPRSQTKQFWCRATAFDCKDNRLLVVEDEDGFYTGAIQVDVLKVREVRK